MSNNPLAGLPLGVLPIHTGRGDEAMRRKEAEANGQHLTAQFITHTESTPVDLAVAAAKSSAPVVADIAIPQVNLMELQEVTVKIKPFEEFVDSTKSQSYVLCDGIGLTVTMEVVYEHKLDLDWSKVNPRVMFAFINSEGTVIGCTDRPTYDEELEDFTMATGQYMTLGKAPENTKRTTLLTLTERSEEEVKPKDELIDVNPIGRVETVDAPYYAGWGRARRRKERASLRGEGKPVPHDL